MFFNMKLNRAQSQAQPGPPKLGRCRLIARSPELGERAMGSAKL